MGCLYHKEILNSTIQLTGYLNNHSNLLYDVVEPNVLLTLNCTTHSCKTLLCVVRFNLNKMLH